MCISVNPKINREFEIPRFQSTGTDNLILFNEFPFMFLKFQSSDTRLYTLEASKIWMVKHLNNK